MQGFASPSPNPVQHRFSKAQLTQVREEVLSLQHPNAPVVDIQILIDQNYDLYGYRGVAERVPGEPHLVIPYAPLGGTRNISYPNLTDNAVDAVGLCRGMLQKVISAGIQLSGAKTALNHPGNLERKQRREYFEAYGRLHAELNVERIRSGLMPTVTAEDSGVGLEDLKHVVRGASKVDLKKVLKSVESIMHPAIVTATRRLLEACPQCITGIEGKSGDPSPFTAFGVFEGGRLLLKLHMDKDLKGSRVVIKGIAGNVGHNLAVHFAKAGAEVFGSDIIFGLSSSELDERKSARRDQVLKIMENYKINLIEDPAKSHEVDGLDIYAPCALSGDINGEVAIALPDGCVVAGAANIPIQNESDKIEAELGRRSIYYAPHFLINSGGVINVFQELVPEPYNAKASLRLVRQRVIDGLLANYREWHESGRAKLPTDIATEQAVAEMKKVAIPLKG
ncbi:MAG: Glu/Leu/Phe/Val dehydrogenase [Bdellovibrionales bacterium]|nr:Glu/Leu/Phe/Val dehydrogenase [Bdellovibrionales bacterium]